jgi:hypothetical protein
VPIATALSIRSSNSDLIERAVRRIQKIIQVTKATAISDITPPKPSATRGESVADENVSNAPTTRLAAMAAPTPAQIAGSRSRRPVRIR